MFPILKEILANDWLILDERKAAYASLLMSMIHGELPDNGDMSEARTKNRAYVIKSSSLVGEEQRLSLHSEAIPEGSIAVIPIRGEIMKYDQECGPRGSLSIVSDIQAAEYNPKIKSILFVIDSPGGMVSYTDVLADKIKSIQKPKIAYVEGMAASAAYWIASGADRIIASSQIDRIGSIGTMLFFMDVQPYYEELGVKFHEIYATKSKDKNKDFNLILDGKYDEYRKNVLDRVNENFIAAIKENRPKVDESVFTGKCYFAPDAISLGLIDEIGTIDYALAQLDPKPEENIPSEIPIDIPENKDNMKIKILAAWTAIMSVFGWNTEEAADKEKEITSEMLEQLNDRLADLQSQNSQLSQQFQDERAAKLQAEEELAALKTSLDAANVELEELKKKDAGGETTATKDKDKTIESTDEPASQKVAATFLGN